jgi:hypothetical protein
MRTWLLGCAVAVGGCDDSIYIEVRVPPELTADTVELFLALDPCKVADRDGDGEPDRCDGIAPPGAEGVHLGNEVYLRDFGDALVTSIDGDRSAWFQLEAGDRTIPVVIAVATLASDPETERGVAVFKEIVLSDGPKRIVADLVDARPLGDPSGNGVEVWRSGRAICAGADRTPGNPVFVVPDLDHDCDGFVADDCDALAHGATIPLSPLPPTCVGVFPATPDNQGACMLGAPACTDGMGVTNACVQSNICVPKATCGCEGVEDLAGCVAASYKTLTTRISCLAPVMLGRDQSLIPCDGVAGAMFADFDNDLFAQADCGAPGFTTVDEPFVDYASTSPVLALETGNGQIVNFGVSSLENRCRFKLDWTEPANALVSTVGRLRSVIQLPSTDTASGEDKLLVLPIDVTFVDCGTTPTCTLEAEVFDPIVNCGL